MVHFHCQTTSEVTTSLMILMHSQISPAQMTDEKTILTGTLP